MDIQSYLATDPKLTRAVVGFAVSEDEVVLGLRKKVSIGLGANLIAGIGGKVGDVAGLEDETDEEALVREFREEIGISISGFRKMGVIRFLYPAKPVWDQLVIAYTVDEWDGTPRETDVIKPQFFKIDDLPIDSMWPDNRYWVPRVLAGEQIEATFLYGEDNKTIAEWQVGEATY